MFKKYRDQKKYISLKLRASRKIFYEALKSKQWFIYNFLSGNPIIYKFIIIEINYNFMIVKLKMMKNIGAGQQKCMIKPVYFWDYFWFEVIIFACSRI